MNNNSLLEKYNYIMNMLINDIPFSFSKMNDGELNAIMSNKDSENTISRGSQKITKELSNKLFEALVYRDDNYFVGIPCSLCYPDMHKYAFKYTDKNIPANLLISNSRATYNILEKILVDKKVVLVCNENADISKLSFKPYICLRVSNNNCFSEYSKYKEGYKLCEEGYICIFCCGPLGRILCYEWFKNNNKLTCLELGSFYDPLTMQKAYMYQSGILRKCMECSPDNDSAFSEEIIDKCNYRERYYLPDYYFNSVYYFYNGCQNLINKFYLFLNKEHFIDDQKQIDYVKAYVECLSNYTNDNIDDIIESKIKLLSSNDNKEGSYSLVNLFKDKNRQIMYKISNNDIDWITLQKYIVELYYKKEYELSHKCWLKLMDMKDRIPEDKLNFCIDTGRFSKFMLTSMKKWILVINCLDSTEDIISEVIKFRINSLYTGKILLLVNNEFNDLQILDNVIIGKGISEFCIFDLYFRKWDNVIYTDVSNIKNLTSDNINDLCNSYLPLSCLYSNNKYGLVYIYDTNIIESNSENILTDMSKNSLSSQKDIIIKYVKDRGIFRDTY
jgi:hypothetical protein